LVDAAGRNYFATMKARVMGHELVMTTTLAQLLRVAKAAGAPLDIDSIVAEIADSVDAGAEAVERSDPVGAAGFRAVGAEALRLLRPATRPGRAREQAA